MYTLMIIMLAPLAFVVGVGLLQGLVYVAMALLSPLIFIQGACEWLSEQTWWRHMPSASDAGSVVLITQVIVIALGILAAFATTYY